ncbi:MAG TPA: hypothetical protein VGL78_10925 [Solirubrobacteraceae bacterium]|jgi:hypothetical protein
MSFQQRVVTDEEYEAIDRNLCGGCLKVRVDHPNDLCPGCEARYQATDELNSSVEELIPTACNFREEVYFATALWRREDQSAHDVDAAREELQAAYEAVLAAADRALRELGCAEAVA